MEPWGPVRFFQLDMAFGHHAISASWVHSAFFTNSVNNYTFYDVCRQYKVLIYYRTKSLVQKHSAGLTKKVKKNSDTGKKLTKTEIDNNEKESKYMTLRCFNDSEITMNEHQRLK